jgi:hypothetical protein
MLRLRNRIVDSQGKYFDGSKTYKVTLPANIPAEKFWSLDIYTERYRTGPLDRLTVDRHAAMFTQHQPPRHEPSENIPPFAFPPRRVCEINQDGVQPPVHGILKARASLGVDNHFCCVDKQKPHNDDELSSSSEFSRYFIIQSLAIVCPQETRSLS